MVSRGGSRRFKPFQASERALVAEGTSAKDSTGTSSCKDSLPERLGTLVLQKLFVPYDIE